MFNTGYLIAPRHIELGQRRAVKCEGAESAVRYLHARVCALVGVRRSVAWVTRRQLLRYSVRSAGFARPISARAVSLTAFGVPVSHNYVGHNYIGHNYIGEGRVVDSLRRPRVP